MDIFEFMKERSITRLDFLRNREPSARDVVNASTYPAVKKMMVEMGHEEVVFFYDKAINARFIVGIHSTLRGPAIGGLRLWAYEKELDAVKDVLRLSRGMTYKSASVNLDIGGGKAVAWLDERGKTPELLKSFANFLIMLEGRYITAEDVGTTVEDMDFMLDEIKSKTDKVCVVCCSEARGGSGNPSPFTAHGVYDGIKLSVKRVFGKDLLKGLTIALQGLGHVGFEVAKKLIDDGVNLVVSELEQAKIKRIQDYAGSKVGFRVVGIDEIYSVDCDLFSPNALGGILNDRTIPQLRCKIVAGAANNQLEDEEKDSELLYKKGIFYTPDFMINAGGVSNAAMEVFDKMHNIPYDKKSVFKKVDEISNNLLDVASISEKENISTYKAALKLAEQRLR
ncbi:MAG: leucine dehydrogenase [Deltaproteobacteria bacterium]|jgi:leucine dehydrogenase|nr:leucine dehydrogenase [Deltaproteobacteria bacterium]